MTFKPAQARLVSQPLKNSTSAWQDLILIDLRKAEYRFRALQNESGHMAVGPTLGVTNMM
jgi:hypothetical protein